VFFGSRPARVSQGRPDIFCVVLAHSEPSALPLCSYSCWVLDNAQACLAAFKHEMDTLGIEPRASRMLSGCDTTTPCARAHVHSHGMLSRHHPPSLSRISMRSALFTTFSPVAQWTLGRVIFRREIASGNATAKCAPCNFGVVAPLCWQHITSSVGTVVILVILARRSRWPQGSIPGGRMFLRGARPLRTQRVAVALVRAPQLGGRLGIPALGPHAMGPRGPEARAHLSGPTQMGKPSAPMHGGPASRAASGGEHGGAAQQTKLICLSTAQRGELLTTPALAARQFGPVV
jgi:hypothetical protein